MSTYLFIKINAVEFIKIDIFIVPYVFIVAYQKDTISNLYDDDVV